MIIDVGHPGAPRGVRGSQGACRAPSRCCRDPLHTTTAPSSPRRCSTSGFSHFLSGAALGGTIVLDRYFDPENVLRAIDENKARVLVVVPVMMQRLLEIPPETRSRYDTSSLEVVAVSGSALTGPLAT